MTQRRRSGVRSSTASKGLTALLSADISDSLARPAASGPWAERGTGERPLSIDSVSVWLIQYPSVFLSEHDPELAKGSASRRISTPYRSPCCVREFYRHLLFRCRQTDSLRQSYGENSLKPHGQRTYPRDPSTRARPASGTHTCSGRQKEGLSLPSN
jgi:hypothetical protein